MTTSRPPHKLTLDILESAFLGSEFFPVRVTRRDGEVIDATKDGALYATVRIVGNAIIVQQVGTGMRAAARATRVSQMLKGQKAAAEAQPYSADAEWARRMDPERRGPYTIRRRTKDGSAGKSLAQHLTRQQLQLRLDTYKDESKLFVVDESDGIEACQVDTGEVPDWQDCECYRCALKSEAQGKGPRTYTVRHGGEVFGSRLDAHDVVEVVDQLDGDASVIDEASGTVVVSPKDGHPVTLRLESLLNEYEADPERWTRGS